MYRWPGASAIVQTVDFFTPIVDDPYVFGQVAAANALSDIYAMGGRPLTALAIAGFPKAGLPREVLAAISRGGYDKLEEAGVALLGGHTVQDDEVKFGYAVTGSIEERDILTNGGARAGDVLLLTKYLGTGIVATAIKNRRCPEAVEAAAIRSMTLLNRTAAQILREVGGDAIRCCTDITGFGLIGHASEMATASGVTIRLEASRLPLLDGVAPLVRRNRTGGAGANEESFGGGAWLSPAIDPAVHALLYDPQTSGGLLVPVAAERADATREALASAGVPAARIGRVEAQGDHLIVVDP